MSHKTNNISMPIIDIKIETKTKTKLNRIHNKMTHKTGLLHNIITTVNNKNR